MKRHLRVLLTVAAADYLFLPKSALPAEGALFFDVATSAYRPFKNTFAAFTAASRDFLFVARERSYPSGLYTLIRSHGKITAGLAENTEEEKGSACFAVSAVNVLFR